jgi:Rrf2 family protein
MSQLISLSEAAAIGLHSMVYIATSKEKLNVNQISEFIGSSRHHVAKVMQRLVKEDFISSNRGPAGGFEMKKTPEEISLLDIYEAIEGHINTHICIGNKMGCPFKKCVFGDLSNRLTLEFKNYMQSHSLAEYIDNQYI